MAKYYRCFFYFIFILVLSSCKTELTADTPASTYCSRDEQICQDVPDEGWCTLKRDDLIRSRWYAKHEPSDKYNYLLLNSMQNYQQCMTIAAQIQPKKNKARKTIRTEALLNITNEIHERQQDILKKRDLFSLYYRWSQLGDNDAKEMFLSRETQPQMNDPILKYALASLYNQSNPKKSLHLLQQSLASYTKQWPIPNYLLEAITTEYMRLNQYEQAYIWSLVLESVGDVNTNVEQLKRYRHFSEDQIDDFKDQAKKLAKEIKNRQYQAPTSGE
ncbi:DUF2989 domain-containing protein [Celerinatantimonas sp. MCCC 1A17872]|uniref:DUF2989 domain-containing protein n=1 Tax=Celerinatantimonas sp. MCCC 1A17872 TaxID=3177514 RepID=UPI0038C93E3A